VASSSETTKMIARSSIAVAPPAKVLGGWEVSGATTSAPLTLSDVTAATKFMVLAKDDSPLAQALGCRFEETRRENASLVVGAGPEEWLVFAPVGQQPAVISALPTEGSPDGSIVVDMTHANVLIRLTGADSIEVVTRMCAMDFSDKKLPNGATFRTSLGRVLCDVIRDDVAGTRSYLIHCDRSSGQYLFDSFLAVGARWGIEVAGYPEAGL
jgi:heterotetrameric sarcosine oxidase gamma subunit